MSRRTRLSRPVCVGSHPRAERAPRHRVEAFASALLSPWRRPTCRSRVRRLMKRFGFGRGIRGNAERTRVVLRARQTERVREDARGVDGARRVRSHHGQTRSWEPAGSSRREGRRRRETRQAPRACARPTSSRGASACPWMIPRAFQVVCPCRRMKKSTGVHPGTRRAPPSRARRTDFETVGNASSCRRGVREVSFSGFERPGSAHRSRASPRDRAREGTGPRR